MSGFWRCVVYAVVLALAAHPLGQALPRRFHPERPPFRPWKWEKNGRIYSRLGIEKWKKLVPDMSRLLPDMVKKELPGRHFVPRADGFSFRKSLRDLPEYSPFAIILIPSLWHESSQLSARRSKSLFFPNCSLSLVPPQI